MYNISSELEAFKNDLTNMFISFNNLNNSDAINKRNSDNIVEVKNQFNMDKVLINSLRNNALHIFDECNKLLMKTEINL